MDHELKPYYQNGTKEGSLKYKADVTEGLENVLVAYKKIFTGENIGKTLVKV